MVDGSWCDPTPIPQSCSLLKNLPISLSPCFLSVPFRFRNVSCMADSPTMVNARYYLSVHLFYSASSNTNDRWHASRGGQTDRQNHHSLMQERGKMKSVQEIHPPSCVVEEVNAHNLTMRGRSTCPRTEPKRCVCACITVRPVTTLI